MAYDFDFSSFRVIAPGAISFTMAEIRVSTNRFIFNTVTAAELAYPSDVMVMVHDEEFLVGLHPHRRDKSTTPFCTPEFFEKRVKRVTVEPPKEVIQFLRRNLGWDDKKQRKAPGIYYRDINTIIFDLKKAELSDAKVNLRDKHDLSCLPTVAELQCGFRPIALPPAAV